MSSGYGRPEHRYPEEDTNKSTSERPHGADHWLLMDTNPMGQIRTGRIRCDVNLLFNKLLRSDSSLGYLLTSEGVFDGHLSLPWLSQIHKTRMSIVQHLRML